MDSSVKKLIQLAKQSGSISLEERALILKKAREKGDNLDEIEMILETLPVEQEIDGSIKSESNKGEVDRVQKKKCPNCGAILSDFILQCPDCGYVFSSESTLSETNRDYIAKLQEQLEKIEKRGPRTKDEKEWDHQLKTNKAEEKARVIRSFSVPNTKESLIQAFVSCFSNYGGSTNDVERAAWLAKAREFQMLIASQPNLDSNTLTLINKYMSAIDDAEKKDKGRRKRELLQWILGAVAILIFLVIIAYMVTNTE